MSTNIAVTLAPGWEKRVTPEWLAGWEPEPFELEGGHTLVVVMGHGPTLLLLPPLPGFKEAFVAVAARLARRRRVVTFDLRARFAGPPDWRSLTDDLERVANRFAPGPAIVVGHSLGGALAQRWVLAHPERVAALVLSSSFAHVRTPRSHWAKRYVEQPLVLASQRLLPERLARPLARQLARRGAWVYDSACDEHVLDFVRHGIRGLPLGLAGQSVRLAMAHDTRARLGEWRGPTLLLRGEREAAWMTEAEEELARLLPGAERRVSPGVSHLHPLSVPAWFAETIEEWLGGLVGQGQSGTKNDEGVPQ